VDLPYPLLWKILVSCVGMLIFFRGRKQRDLLPSVCGGVMMALPYMVESALLLTALAAGLGWVVWWFRN